MDAVEEFLLIDTDLNPYSLIKDVCTLTVSLSSGPVSYAETFNHLWAYIRSHEHKSELVKRLSEELLDSVNVCANGKLARLVNVVEGYMEGVSTANQKELFQNRMAVIAKMAKSEQLEAATKAFKEFEIPQDEQEAWLEALED
jgi:predicted house-cleaning noncanonical NTP pyrophosphatase (MazG superfamily)